MAPSQVPSRGMVLEGLEIQAKEVEISSLVFLVAFDTVGRLVAKQAMEPLPAIDSAGNGTVALQACLRRNPAPQLVATGATGHPFKLCVSMGELPGANEARHDILSPRRIHPNDHETKEQKPKKRSQTFQPSIVKHCQHPLLIQLCRKHRFSMYHSDPDPRILQELGW